MSVSVSDTDIRVHFLLKAKCPVVQTYIDSNIIRSNCINKFANHVLVIIFNEAPTLCHVFREVTVIKVTSVNNAHVGLHPSVIEGHCSNSNVINVTVTLFLLIFDLCDMRRKTNKITALKKLQAISRVCFICEA